MAATGVGRTAICLRGLQQKKLPGFPWQLLGDLFRPLVALFANGQSPWVAQARVTTTGAWSLGLGHLRGVRSMLQALTSSTSGPLPRLWSLRYPLFFWLPSIR